MSLRVWLPLNGDLRNQGLNDVVVTNSGAVVNSSGKIGSCYAFDGSNDFISLTGDILYQLFTGGQNQFSICMWVYHNDTTRAVLFGDYRLSGSINFNIELTTAHQVRFYWNGSPDKTFNAESSVGLQTWTHICLIYNGTTLRLYRNGILLSDTLTGSLSTKTKTTGAYYLGRDSRTGATVLNGRLNDFRIYDHVLSEQEVKRISQGLILHYPLDNRGLGNVNLAYNTKNLSPGASSQVEYKAYKVGLLNVADGETVTISFDLDMTITTANNYLLVYNSNKKGPHRIQSVLALPNESVSVGDHIQKRVSVVTTISDRTTGVTETEDWIEFYSNYDTENEIIINNIKVERGDKATTWSPSPFDDLYITTLQLNDTSVKDISGFNNNANYNNLNGVDFAQVGQALVGTSHNFTFNIDTPIYEVSTNFNHIDNYIIGESPSLQGRTVTCWIKFKERGNQVAFIDYKSGCSFGIYSTYVPVACKSISYHQCYNKDIFVANTWYFIAVVRDDDNEKVDLYVNGEKQTPVSSTDYWSSNVSDKLTIGARTNGTTLFNGVMSDFRIYATKLSEDDIKTLYEYRS